MIPTTRVLPAVVAVGAAALVAVTSMPTATAASGNLKGTVSWTTTVTLNDDQHDDVGFGDLRTGTTTWTTTMKLSIARKGGTRVVVDSGSSYIGSFSDNRTTQERSNDGTVNCTITSVGTGKAGGRLPKNPQGSTAPAVFAELIGKKAIVLTPILRYTGTQTTTYTGVGISPCQSGQDVDPIDGSLAPTWSSEWICYPPGTGKALRGQAGSQVWGAWSAGKKGYSFNCTHTWQATGGQTITTKLTGQLK